MESDAQPRPTSRRPRFIKNPVLPYLLAGAAVGTAIALWRFAPEFITGTGGLWRGPRNDHIAYLVAWHYFVIDEWRLPLFSLPAMGYPEGGNVLSNDALPLTALATRILYRLTGHQVNPYGWWLVLHYIFHGAMAARLVCAMGVRSMAACITAAVLALTNVYFMSRMEHVALGSQFVLLWAMAAHFESLRRGRARIGELGALLALTLLINAYLFVMVLAFGLVTALALWQRGQFGLRDLRHSAIALALVAALGLLSGYGLFLANPASMRAHGFGVYSWNLVGLLVPPRGFFGFLAGITRDATGGQYDGDAWIGYGALALLMLAAAFSPRQALEAARRYWHYVALLALFTAYAASNRVYVGNRLVASVPLPDLIAGLCSYFRASGRFIWPLAYSLAVLPVALIFRTWRPLPALLAAALGIFLQLYEAAPVVSYRRLLTTRPYEDLIDQPRMASWLEQHERLWQFPSFYCGGLSAKGDPRDRREANRELQVQLAAAKAGVPTNSVYMSRPLKNCERELSWRQDPVLRDGVLYVFNTRVVAESRSLTAIARTNACVTLEWAVVCSTKWKRQAESSGDTSALRGPSHGAERGAQVEKSAPRRAGRDRDALPQKILAADPLERDSTAGDEEYLSRGASVHCRTPARAVAAIAHIHVAFTATVGS